MPERERESKKLIITTQKKKRTYDGVKESGLPDIWKTNDSGFEAHAYCGRKASLLQSQNSHELV